jgi:uncharacterized protein YndB with AHSA1/START domain
MTDTLGPQMTDTDRIEKEIQLRAPKARVWQAISDSAEFGTWFGMKFDAPFMIGSTVHGQITSPGYEHLVIEMKIETIEPQDVFAYRWHPNAMDTAVDYSKEPMTLVEFRLHETADGTRLTLVESGFDALPPERRSPSLVSNGSGWKSQMERIRRHVDG